MLEFKEYKELHESIQFDVSDIGKSLIKHFNMNNPYLSKEEQFKVSDILDIMKRNTKITLNALRMYMVSVIPMENKKDNQKFNLWWESCIKNLWKNL